MKRSFYYAGLDWTVTIEDKRSGILKALSDNEVHILQILLWHSCNAFFTCRTLCVLDAVEYAKRIKNCRPKDTDIVGGG